MPSISFGEHVSGCSNGDFITCGFPCRYIDASKVVLFVNFTPYSGGQNRPATANLVWTVARGRITLTFVCCPSLSRSTLR